MDEWNTKEMKWQKELNKSPITSTKRVSKLQLRKYNLDYLKELGYKNTDSKSNTMLNKLVENEQIRKAESLSLQARIKNKEIELKKAKKNEKNIFKNMTKNEMEYYKRSYLNV